MDVPFGRYDLGNHGLKLKISSNDGKNSLEYWTMGKAFLQTARLMTSERSFQTLQANVACGGIICARIVLQTTRPGLAASDEQHLRNGIDQETQRLRPRVSANAEGPDQGGVQSLAQAQDVTPVLALNVSTNISRPLNDANGFDIECHTGYFAHALPMQSKDIFLGIMDNIVKGMPTAPTVTTPKYHYKSSEYNLAMDFGSYDKDPRTGPFLRMGVIITMQRTFARHAVKERRFAEMVMVVTEVGGAQRQIGWGEIKKLKA